MADGKSLLLNLIATSPFSSRLDSAPREWTPHRFLWLSKLLLPYLSEVGAPGLQMLRDLIRLSPETVPLQAGEIVAALLALRTEEAAVLAREVHAGLFLQFASEARAVFQALMTVAASVVSGNSGRSDPFNAAASDTGKSDPFTTSNFATASASATAPATAAAAQPSVVAVQAHLLSILEAHPIALSDLTAPFIKQLDSPHGALHDLNAIPALSSSVISPSTKIKFIRSLLWRQCPLWLADLCANMHKILVNPIMLIPLFRSHASQIPDLLLDPSAAEFGMNLLRVLLHETFSCVSVQLAGRIEQAMSAAAAGASQELGAGSRDVRAVEVRAKLSKIINSAAVVPAKRKRNDREEVDSDTFTDAEEADEPAKGAVSRSITTGENSASPSMSICGIPFTIDKSGVQDLISRLTTHQLNQQKPAVCKSLVALATVDCDSAIFGKLWQHISFTTDWDIGEGQDENATHMWRAVLLRINKTPDQKLPPSFYEYLKTRWKDGLSSVGERARRIMIGMTMGQDPDIRLLTSLTNHQDLSIRETAIVTIGYLGRCQRVPETYLKPITLLLVDQFGQSMAYLRSTAFRELQNIAASRNVHVYKLFSPFWDEFALSLACSIVNVPTKIELALSLISRRVEDFLGSSLPRIMPQLVELRRKDALLLIADILGQPIQKLMIDQNSDILFHAYMLSDKHLSRKVFNFHLELFDRHNRGFDQKTIIQAGGHVLLAKLAIELGSDDPQIAHIASAALKSIEIVIRGSKRDTSAEAEPHLSSHILGVMDFMSSALHDPNSKAIHAKIIRSMGRLIGLIGAGICAVSPQMMGALENALETPSLRTSAISTLHIFVTTLAYKDIGSFIGRVSAMYVTYWHELETSDQIVVKSTLKFIIDNHQQLEPHFFELVDLSGLSGLKDLASEMSTLKSRWSFDHKVNVILTRAENENQRVRLQALLELKKVLLLHNADLTKLTSGDTFDPLISKIITILLQNCSSSPEHQDEIRAACYDSLGLLGAIDPDRAEMTIEDSKICVLRNFTDHDESINFVLNLLANDLLGAYRSTNDSRGQQDIGYAIQELFKFCGFREELLAPDHISNNNPVSLKTRQRWQSLPKGVPETLATLLKGKYKFEISKDICDFSHPVYKTSQSYNEWVQSWTTDLINRVDGTYADSIFKVFLPAVRSDDVTVARALLPYLVINVLARGSSQSRNDIFLEIQEVLKDQVDMASSLVPSSRLLAAQLIFSLMDYISSWVRRARIEFSSKKAALGRKGSNKHIEYSHDMLELEKAMKNVEQTLSSIPSEQTASAALKCKAYARALMSFEQQVNIRLNKGESNDDLQDILEHLHEIYAQIDEPDGMEGITTKVLSPGLEHQIREHESTGRWTAAQSCWEVKMQQKPDDLNLHLGLLKCLRSLGHYDTMRTHIVGALSKHEEWRMSMSPYLIEGAWMVNDWKAVQDLVKSYDTSNSPEFSLGKVLLAMKDGDPVSFFKILNTARLNLGAPILAAGKDAYRRSYESLGHLHMLYDLELIFRATYASKANEGISSSTKLISLLDSRLRTTLPSFRAREPILSFRRSALSLVPPHELLLSSEIGRTWLTTAKIARKAGHNQTAYTATLQASRLGAKFSFLETAKLLHDSGQSLRAMQELDSALSQKLPKDLLSKKPLQLRPDDAKHEPKYNKQLAKAVLVRAQWISESERFSKTDILKRFEEAVTVGNSFENAHFQLGRYHDECQERQASHSKEHDSDRLCSVFATCKHYAKALSLGTKHIYRAMPRMLTLWMDSGSTEKNDSLKKTSATARRDWGQEITDLIARYVRILPNYAWYLAFPQIVSRIGHPDKAVYSVLEQLMTAVLLAYPHQAMWCMIAVSKSTKKQRAKRCDEVFRRVKGSTKIDPSTPLLMNDCVALTDELLKLCNKQISDGDGYRMSMSRTIPNLSRLNIGKTIMLPIQSSMIASLPTSHDQSREHQPFPSRPVLIRRFIDEVEVMKSVAKPKKFSVQADNGLTYSFLAKPDDDLRKDARLMDFNSIINKLLKANGDSRKRGLHIRCYIVVPLNERCGLIEWVNDTRPLRAILIDRYKARNVEWWSNTFAPAIDGARPKGAEAIAKTFRNVILSACKPVFHEWFLETFPEPTAWLSGRTMFGRSAAVMSMVGFILGLGDRHGENILLDTNNGAVQHVDFNCLFDKGKTFDVAEKVPFRMTQNMVDGLGVTGVEGVYRKASEVTLQILRDNRESLMSVLEAFLHDPVVDWEDEKKRKDMQRLKRQTGNSKSRKSTITIADEDDDDGISFVRSLAMKALEPINRKLAGNQTTMNGDLLPREASVPNQVESLIQEATSVSNLASMYIGWAGWM